MWSQPHLNLSNMASSTFSQYNCNFDTHNYNANSYNKSHFARPPPPPYNFHMADRFRPGIQCINSRLQFDQTNVAYDPNSQNNFTVSGISNQPLNDSCIPATVNIMPPNQLRMQVPTYAGNPFPYVSSGYPVNHTQQQTPIEVSSTMHVHAPNIESNKGLSSDNVCLEVSNLSNEGDIPLVYCFSCRKGLQTTNVAVHTLCSECERRIPANNTHTVRGNDEPLKPEQVRYLQIIKYLRDFIKQLKMSPDTTKVGELQRAEGLYQLQCNMYLEYKRQVLMHQNRINFPTTSKTANNVNRDIHSYVQKNLWTHDNNIHTSGNTIQLSQCSQSASELDDLFATTQVVEQDDLRLIGDLPPPSSPLQSLSAIPVSTTISLTTSASSNTTTHQASILMSSESNSMIGRTLESEPTLVQSAPSGALCDIKPLISSMTTKLGPTRHTPAKERIDLTADDPAPVTQSNSTKTDIPIECQPITGINSITSNSHATETFDLIDDNECVGGSNVGLKNRYAPYTKNSTTTAGVAPTGSVSQDLSVIKTPQNPDDTDILSTDIFRNFNNEAFLMFINSPSSTAVAIRNKDKLPSINLSGQQKPSADFLGIVANDD